MEKKLVTIVDSLPGSGKTEWAIAHMKLNLDRKWMFITPYLNELKRVQASAPELHFVDPNPEKSGTKLKDLKAIVADGRNVCSTHELFKLFDREALDLIEAQNYSLVMDECMEVISPRDRSPKEVQGLLAAGVLVAEGDGPVKTIRPGLEDRLEKYAEEHRFASEGRLVLVDGVCLAWAFPPDTFIAFNEVFNLGFAFEGQQLSAFFQIHNEFFTLEKMSVTKNNEGDYELAPYATSCNINGLLKLAPLIDVYDGHLNQAVVQPNQRGSGMYSYTWLSKSENLKVAAGKLYSWLKIVGAKPRDTIWTVFKFARNESAPPTILQHSKNLQKDFGRSFVSISTRATNKWQDRHVAAYLGNRFLHPYVQKFFKAKGVELDEGVYALSELLQWLFRSAIRQGERVQVFVPAFRMRRLLKDWLRLPKAEVVAWSLKAEEDLEAAGLEAKAA